LTYGRPFGEKDCQQVALVRQMDLDLDLDIEVVGLPTVREPDSLALTGEPTAARADVQR
jgi:pantothenate synthetase